MPYLCSILKNYVASKYQVNLYLTSDGERKHWATGLIDMYTLTHRICVSDTSIDALTREVFKIGYRYTDNEGSVMDHYYAKPLDGLHISYVPITE